MKTRFRLTITVCTLIACCTLLAGRVTFNFAPEVDGLFILQGEKGDWLEITDDLVPEDATRLIWGKPLYLFKNVVENSKCVDSTKSCIDFTWDKKNGRGFIRNTWPDGSKLVINLGRFKDSNGKYPAGIFIGGGLPTSDPDYRFMNNDATGMTYFDGRRWNHVWCNANEGLIFPTAPFFVSYPSDWNFKGSWVRENDGTNLTIESRHRLLFSGIPIDVKRLLFYTAGNSYVILATEFTNLSTIPFPFQYMYGDEPWIGDFGSSAGDVGWMERELILTEREVDTKQNSYFGMFDYGNELVGEEHHYTGIANFIEWEKRSRPEKAYISNDSGGVRSLDKAIPLVSPSNRFIGLQYGPKTLKPGESFAFSIAVGMAARDTKTGLPLKPKTELNP